MGERISKIAEIKNANLQNSLSNQEQNDKFQIKEKNIENVVSKNSIIKENIGNKGSENKYSDQNKFNKKEKKYSLRNSNTFQEKEGSKYQQNSKADEKKDINYKRRAFSQKEISFTSQKCLHQFLTKNQGWINRELTPNVFISSYKDFKSYEHLGNLPYPKTFVKQIENFGINKFTNLESWSLPAINENLNTLLIGPKKSGKTLSYLFPFLNRILCEDFSYLPPGNSPYLIILVSSWKSGQKIFDICENLINCSHFPILQIYGDGREKEKFIELVNGCKILITTPPCYARLYLTNKLIINCKRIIGLVFEDANILLDRFENEIKSIIKECSRIKNRSDPIQFIVCSEIWEDHLNDIFNQMDYKRTVIISSPLEAAIFAGIQFKFNLINGEDKLNHILKLIEKNKSKKKTIIICNNSSQLKELTRLSTQLHHPEILIADGSTFHTEIQDIFHNWKNNRDSLILICTDDVIPSLGLRDVECLIHYTLPPISKTQFSQRFATLLDHLSPHAGCSQHLESHLLIDESVNDQIPEIIYHIRRLGLTIHPELESRSLKIRQITMTKKYKEILCFDLKAFGQCWNERTCRYRHIILPELDKPAEGVPQYGKVTLHLLGVQENCSLSARILKHESSNGAINCKINKFDYLNLSMKLSLYCNKPLKREKAVEEGEIWAYKDKKGCPKRVKILKIDNFNVLAYFLDEAITKTIDQRYLIPLSEDLANFPAQAVQVFMCNLLPCDLDQSWNPHISSEIYSWLKISREHSYELVGKINLALEHCLWLDPIEIIQYLPTTKAYSIELVLRNNLLSNTLAIDNPNHMERLRRICLDAGLAISELKPKVISTEKIRDKAQWAHLNMNEWVEINLMHIKNPDYFLIRQIKFQNNLNQLNKELQNVFKNIIKRPKILKEGDFVAFRIDQEHSWQRGKIISVLDNNNKAEILGIDDGKQLISTIENIGNLPEKLLDQLPCQIIEASLMGIESTLPGSWSQESINCFSKLSKTNENHSSVFAKVCEKRTKCQLTGGTHYRIVLMNNFTVDSLSINARLIAQGLAKLIESEKEFIFDIKLPQMNKDLDDTEEELNSIKNVVISLDKRSSTTTTSNINEKNKKINNVNQLEMRNKTNNEDEEGFEFCIDDPVTFIKNAITSPKENDVGLQLLQFINLANSNNNDNNNIQNNQLENTNIKAITSSESSKNYDVSILTKFLQSDSLENLTSEQKIQSEKSDHYENNIIVSENTQDNVINKVFSEEEKILQELHELASSNYCQFKDIPDYNLLTLPSTTTWEQDHQFIYIKIYITGVENYYISCENRDFRFITNNPNNNFEKFYINLSLYGTVSLYNHEKSGFYVSIKLLKNVYGYTWPFLLKNGAKTSWIKPGTDLIEKKSYINQLIEDMQTVNHLEPPEENEFLTEIPIIEDKHEDNENEDTDSEDEEFLLKKLVTHNDPYDPFN